MVKKEVKAVTGWDFGNICGLSVQDGAAKGVARFLELEVETCDMHDSNKIGRSATGELLRCDGRGGIVNEFAKGKEMMNKLRDQGKHFYASHIN